MNTTKCWKYIQSVGYHPILFDLQKDLMELNDVGEDAGFFKIKRELNDKLSEWSLRHL